MEIMAGDNDEGSFFDDGGDFGWNRVPVGGGIGVIEEGHAFQVDLAKLHQQGQPFVDGVFRANGPHSFVEPIRDFFITVAEDGSVPGVGGHPPKPKEEQGTQGDQISVAVP